MRPFSADWFRQERAKMRGQGHVWPLAVALAVVGVGALTRFIYKGWWPAAAVGTLWLVILTVVGGPAQTGWKKRRQEKRGDQR
ncbi:MAG: hypothetical protein ABR549_09595 [Mycobacteriales bacterium]